MIELAHQLLKEAESKSDDEESTEASSSTQVKKEKKKWADYSDVDDQDPYDFSPLDLGSDGLIFSAQEDKVSAISKIIFGQKYPDCNCSSKSKSKLLLPQQQLFK